MYSQAVTGELKKTLVNEPGGDKLKPSRDPSGNFRPYLMPLVANAKRNQAKYSALKIHRPSPAQVSIRKQTPSSPSLTPVKSLRPQKLCGTAIYSSPTIPIAAKRTNPNTPSPYLVNKEGKRAPSSTKGKISKDGDTLKCRNQPNILKRPTGSLQERRSAISGGTSRAGRVVVRIPQCLQEVSPPATPSPEPKQRFTKRNVGRPACRGNVTPHRNYHRKDEETHKNSAGGEKDLRDTRASADSLDELLEFFDSLQRKEPHETVRGPCKLAEREFTHLLSGYQTLFGEACSPTCVSLPAVVSSRGDRRSGVPPRRPSSQRRRLTSPPRWFATVCGLSGGDCHPGEGAVSGTDGETVSGDNIHGSPFWRPLPLFSTRYTRPSRRQRNTNDNANNSNESVLSASVPCFAEGLDVIMETGFEEAHPAAVHSEGANESMKNSSRDQHLTVLKMLEEYAENVTSSNEVTLGDLRKGLLSEMKHWKGKAAMAGASSANCSNVVDVTVKEFHRRRQSAAQVVCSHILSILNVATRKTPCVRPSRNLISEFWK